MTLNLPLLYWFWFVEYCQTSPNKSKSPKLWHVTSIVVCCILDLAPIYVVFSMTNRGFTPLYGPETVFWDHFFCFSRRIFMQIPNMILHCSLHLNVPFKCTYVNHGKCYCIRHQLWCIELLLLFITTAHWSGHF